MSASEVAPNPFWYAKPTAALTSRDRLSICVLAIFVPKSVNQLFITGVGRPVKPPAWFWPAAVPGVGSLAEPRSRPPPLGGADYRFISERLSPRAKRAQGGLPRPP